MRPSFITTAASAVRRRALNSCADSVPGSAMNTSSRFTSGVPALAAAALKPVTPGITVVSYLSASRSCRYMYEP